LCVLKTADWKNICASNFSLNWEKCYGNFQHAESSFWKTDVGKNTSSSKFESGVSSVEDDECSDCPAVSKTDEKCGLNEGTCS
jgi:hypothetical protein